MTEAEWLASNDPNQLLTFLHDSYIRLSTRKLRLFAARCCRSLLTSRPEDQETARAVDTLERYAEGWASVADLRAASRVATAYALGEWGTDHVYNTVFAATRVANDEYLLPAIQTAAAAQEAAHRIAERGSRMAERSAQSDWIRDIFPSPYRPKHVTKCWFGSYWGAVRSLAVQMYASQDFAAMPVLADALEEAGCDNSDVLSHCRGPGPHVRGCWVVDLVLGKS